jgi:hypothetical protein
MCHEKLEKLSFSNSMSSYLPAIKPWWVIFVRLEVEDLVAVVHGEKVDGQLQARHDLRGNRYAAVQELVPVDAPEPRVLLNGQRTLAVTSQSPARINHKQLFLEADHEHQTPS